MLAALLLDLGDTLESGGVVLPHVPEALAALARLPIQLALVSNDTADGDPVDDTKFDDYVEIVRGLDLLRFFEPVAAHVTTSSLVGVTKPRREIFEHALARLRLPVELATAMFITEQAAHVAAARALGMTAWQYGVDFTDWAEAPDLVKNTLDRGRYEASLTETNVVAEAGEALAPGQTHQRDADGAPRRKRFSLT